MYDFVEVKASTSTLLESISRELRGLGEDVVADSPESSEHSELMSYWLSGQMYMSQSCGLPYVEELSTVVDVLGTFRWNDISDDFGNYRTHIVVRGEHGATTASELRGARPVISTTQSLSGWCSLGCALAEVSRDPDFVQPYLIGHHHAGSLQLLQDGIADVASIDPATYQLFRRFRPSLVHGLRIIGSGPPMPATPIIASKTRTAPMSDLRSVLHRVVGDNLLRDEMSEIGIVGFVNRDASDYEMIRDLVAIAEVVLPRRE
ncbi:MAG: PhnD/SsuA/transferrin family substrate-binding protein [Ilumatobacteraceae bacterium]